MPKRQLPAQRGRVSIESIDAHHYLLRVPGDELYPGDLGFIRDVVDTLIRHRLQEGQALISDTQDLDHEGVQL